MFVQSALNVLEIVTEEWRIHINKICYEKFLLNKKISTFFRRKWEKSCSLGILRYLRRICTILRVALVPPTNFFIFSVSHYEVVLYGCNIATITRKFIFAPFLRVKVGYLDKISPFWRFLMIFFHFIVIFQYVPAFKWPNFNLATFQ